MVPMSITWKVESPGQDVVGDSESMTVPSLTIIVPTSGQSPYIHECLGRILTVAADPFVREVLLVINGARQPAQTQDWIAFADEHKPDTAHKLKIINEPVPGLLAGRHRGAAEASGSFLSFIDDDVVLGENWVRSVAEICLSGALEDRIAGGPVVPDFRGLVPRWLPKLQISLSERVRLTSELSLISLDVEEPCNVSPLFVFGLNFTIARKTLYTAGGFSPDLTPKELLRFRGNGETAIAEQLISWGKNAIWHPGLKVQHIIGTERLTIGYVCKIWMRQGVSDQFQAIRKTYSTGNFGHINIMGTSRQFFRKASRIFSPNQVQSRGKLLTLIRLVYLTAGRLFLWHQYRTDPKVAEWIERKNFIRYSYPS